MTVIMTAKNQITIPKKITNVLHLEKGTMFEVRVSKNAIELVPVETKEIEFTEAQYQALEALAAREKGKERKVTKSLIKALKKKAT